MKSQTLVTLAAILALGGQAWAQEAELQLPDLTPEQRWDRSADLATVNFAVMIAYAKSRGQTVEEFGRYLGEVYAPSWNREAAGQPLRVFRGIYRNWMTWPDFRAEIVSASQSAVTARFNRAYAATFGDDGELYGCTVREFERVLELTHQGIADYLDLQYEQRQEGESLIVTLRKKTSGSH